MKIGIGLSGGVDSAISAYLLKQEGYEVKGYTMKLFDSQESEIQSASDTAKQIGIPHEIIDLKEDFEKEVVSEFIDMYKSGLTPNPCLICNRKIKYGKLIDYAIKDGMDGFSMGHHVKKAYDKELQEYILLKSDDKRKDQSYNLYRLTSEQLETFYFPAGNYSSKSEIREIADKIGLKVADKSDSTGICFLGNMSMKAYLKKIDNELNKVGTIIDNEGNFLGRHDGIYKYTIGQKKRLPEDIAKYNSKNPDNPYTVIEILSDENKIVVGKESLLYKSIIYLNETNFISKKHTFPLRVSVKLSQWSPEYSGTVYLKDEITSNSTDTDTNANIYTSTNANANINTSTNANIEHSKKSKHELLDYDSYIVFDEPCRAPAPGQAAVFYQDDRLLGGGVIVYSEL